MRALLVATMLTVVMTTGRANAQAHEERETDLTVDAEENGLDEEARIVYEAGVVAYQEQRFDNALEYFQRAHELSGRPQMLFNIGLVADRLRRDELAVESYEAFLHELPDAANRGEVEERLRLLRAGLEAQRPATTAQAEEGGANAAAIVLVSLGGLAVGGAIAGAIWWADRADVLSQCDARGCANVGTIEGERSAAIGVTIAAGVVGLAALTTGVILLASGRGRSDAGESALACGVSPFGVSCAGRF